MDSRPAFPSRKALFTYARIFAQEAAEATLQSIKLPLASSQNGELERIRSTVETTQQVLQALRQYAGQQQDRLERLDEGHDWIAVKRFALRIAKCIDSVETRMTRHAPESAPHKDLNEVRLELSFLLESNDVVRWQPTVGTDFRSYLQKVEVIDTRAVQESHLDGTILEILQPAYLFEMPDREPKVLRCAQIVVARREDPK